MKKIEQKELNSGKLIFNPCKPLSLVDNTYCSKKLLECWSTQKTLQRLVSNLTNILLELINTWKIADPTVIIHHHPKGEITKVNSIETFFYLVPQSERTVA